MDLKILAFGTWQKYIFVLCHYNFQIFTLHITYIYTHITIQQLLNLDSNSL